MSFKIPGFDDFDKNETEKDLSDPLGDISLDDEFYGISNTPKPSTTKLTKEDHSRKIANIFGLDDTNAPSVSKPNQKPTTTSSNASDWLGLKDSPSPQKKAGGNLGRPETASNLSGRQETAVNLAGSSFGARPETTAASLGARQETAANLGGRSETTNLGGGSTRRNSEAQVATKPKPLRQEYKSLDLDFGSDKEDDLGGGFARGVQIKENLMDPGLARGSRRSSLKVDSILNFDLASATEDLNRKIPDGVGAELSTRGSEFNSLDLEKSLVNPSGTPSSDPNAREARTQQTKDDLSAFFSISTTQPRRPGLSRRRETSPNPTPLGETAEGAYDWLGTSTAKKDIGLPSWLLGPEENKEAPGSKTGAAKSETPQDLKQQPINIAADSKPNATSQVKPQETMPGVTANPPQFKSTDQTNSIEPDQNKQEPADQEPLKEMPPDDSDDHLIQDLQRSVGSVIDIKSYNRMVQDQTRLINTMIRQQSDCMNRLIQKLAGVQRDDVGGDGETAEDGEETQVQNKDLLAEKETLELSLKHATMIYEHRLTILDTKYKDTIAMLEEKSAHRMAMKQEEFDVKVERWNDMELQYKAQILELSKQKDEAVVWYKKRLEEVHQEYSDEIKTLRETIEHLKAQYNEEVKSKRLSVPSTETEWTERETQLIEKERQLQEQSEHLKSKSHQLDEKRKELDNEREDFELKKFRDQNAINAEMKRLKRAHNLLTIEQEHWEEEMSKEREQVKKMREQLEKMRDHLQNDQEALGVEWLKLATEKSKIDVLLKMNSGVDLIQSKAEAESMMQVAKATIASVRDTKEKLQDEKARLMDLEQEVILRERMAEKLIRMSEQKQTEGLNALEESKRLEATFKHKSEAIQQQLAELSIREHKLTKEKFEIQREKELIEKRKEKLFAFLPDVENTIQPAIIDPRSIITRLRAEKDIEND
ncbi:hypothetical protein M8J77_013221 [Diaphorina citri]|nr:hypothetical protein M8J77_013221 [Diaphorina citri]